MKQHMFMALSFASVIVSSCYKDDDSKGGGGPNPPALNLGLVGPADFKNTFRWNGSSFRGLE